MELYLPTKPKQSRPKIIWTEAMIIALKEKYPFTYNKLLAKQIGVSWRSLVRKARELNIDKEDNFLDNRRDEITAMAVKANHNPHTGQKGWYVPGGEDHRFKPGNISIMKTNPEIVEKVRNKRNATIQKEKFRIKFGLQQQTNLRLINIY